MPTYIHTYIHTYIPKNSQYATLAEQKRSIFGQKLGGLFATCWCSIVSFTHKQHKAACPTDKQLCTVVCLHTYIHTGGRAYIPKNSQYATLAEQKRSIARHNATIGGPVRSHHAGVALLVFFFRFKLLSF